MDRAKAEQHLQKIFKIDRFYEDQWLTISKIIKGERILLIQKTGFGKSLCYQFPATLFKGLTVIFSPLIALMRDQVHYLSSIGIPAACVNSEQELQENRNILKKAQTGQLKILYIAPERQENDEWQEAVRSMKLAMVVIDEAHCISVWGHDFRPAFKRIVNLVNLLPSHFPVLATTATATTKVAQDIQQQIGAKVTLIRGSLLRENFSLNVVSVKSEDEKLVWLRDFLRTVEGSGLIYTGTRVATETVASWLQFNHIDAVNYNAGLSTQTRKEIEAGLYANRWKCIVSTNALGMGIDKPDIRFIVHSQAPQSLIHYYQEIGRAGRDGKPTKLFLLFSEEDLELPRYFIENNRPSRARYEAVINALKKEPLGEWDIIRATNLTQAQIRVIKADLLEQGIIKEVMYKTNKKFEYQFKAPLLNFQVFDQLREFKFQELEQMHRYVQITDCRMAFLCNYLGDPNVARCGNCDIDMSIQHAVHMTNDVIKQLEEFRNTNFPELRVELKNNKMINGVAASYYGVSEVGSIIHRCKYEHGGDFPDELVELTIKAFRKKLGHLQFDLILPIPPTESGELVTLFSQKIAERLGIPIAHGLKKIRKTNPQKQFENSILKRDNVKDAFIFTPEWKIRNKKILLIDDIFDSGVTMKEVGRYLTTLGATLIAPLVIAKTVGGDTI